MLNPVWIQTFATVAAARSFTDAGRQLGLSQSSVSEHIRRLEENVGRRLFVRDTHSLAMTPDGEALLVHARLILQALARAESQFSAPRLQGRVRLGTSDDLAQGPLPKVLAAFRNSHPDVELEITIGMTGKLYELMDAGTLDLMIGKRRDGERRGVPLFHGALEWLAVPGTVADLSRPLPLILVNEPSVTRAVVLDTLAKAGVQWRIVCSSSSHSGCVAAARGGLGLTVRARDLAGRGLVPPVNADSLPALPQVEFISLAARRLSRPAETLLRLLQKSDLRGSRLDD
ncbi:LysR family transcriptional regulator [Cupriavidus sp. USMAA2-4]|uniref:LysR family transcriptional regulator n=1 Tax=Cupriavidus malaysiensis TaxID=367825 RepID=A0ABN4TWR6_9BURK|nr:MULTISPECIES: LysR family transcriptional regulator [Cupriavidus]AOY96634.1 LysR family transcriptional regulator [Cupriavidus sp. USMAA2-4]AOZ09668.1 LysR family transcriptional regulator [Cupriavidus malaysiensis]